MHIPGLTDPTWYERIFVMEWPWWIGGPAIGLYVIAFLLVKNRLLSASTTFQFVTDRWLAFGKKADASMSWLTEDDAGRDGDWRGHYFLGLFAGGLASVLLAGTFHPAFELKGLHSVYGYALATQIGVLLTAGVLIGFGTRMSGGCTSGHCIVGVSGLQAPSAAATGVFFACGIVISFAAERVFNSWGGLL